jgi:hypothetical protein
VKACNPEHYQQFALRLLDDPTEIWRHAYEEQISHAARSALLALHSLNGRVDHNRLIEAFDALHAARAARYGFTMAPGDFLRALRVLSGAFITILRDAVQFINPSVRDLMNTILHDAPDNCLDILRGAVSMIQVSAIWNLAEMRDGEHIQSRIERALPTLIDGFRRAMDAKLFAYRNGFFTAYSPLIETRLALLVEIAGHLDNRALDPLIGPAVERTIQVWRDEKPDVGAAIRAIDLLGQYALALQSEFQALRQRLLSALATQTQIDLEPDEMVRLLTARQESWAPEERKALRAMAERWPRDMGDRLRACRSAYELQQLGENLRAVRDALTVDLRGPIQAVDVELQLSGSTEEAEARNPEPPSPQDYLSQMDRFSTHDLFATLRPLGAGRGRH